MENAFSVPNKLELRPRQVDVWRANLDVTPGELRVLSAALSKDEMDRASQFRFVRHRNLFIASRGILRRILSRYVQAESHELELRSSPSGKPQLNCDGPKIEFNLSHSGALALYAVAQRQLGIDVEQIDPRFVTSEVAAIVLSKREFAEFSALPELARTRVFFTIWTCKEAYLKANGKGLAGDLKNIEVGLDDVYSRLLDDGEKTWLLLRVKSTKQYSAALVVDGCSANVRYRDFLMNIGTPPKD